MQSDREIVIEAGQIERRYWLDLWFYRELFFFLAWREILVRYKQTVIGIAWVVIRPLLTMSVFTLVFGRFAKLPAEGMPYPILVLSALLPWQLFSSAVTEGSMSLVSNANMVSKIYFPRIIVPASAIAVSAIDFFFSALILAAMMAMYGVSPGWKVLLLPLFLILTCMFALGMTILFSALNVRYRDFRYVVGFIIQFGLLISPVAFSISIVPEQWQLVYALNPMVGIIEGFRWCLAETPETLNTSFVLLSLLVSAVILVAGLWYFRATERTFADVI
jgi:lipopolysaccharide transport system permease protein